MAERSRESLVDVGGRYPGRLLVEQTGALLTLAKVDEAVLGPFGFPAAKQDEVKNLSATLEKQLGDQRLAKEEMPAATVNVHATLKEAKEWQRELIACAKNAFEEEGPEAVDDFVPKGAIGRSVPRMQEYLTQAIAKAEQRGTELVSWGFTAEKIARGKALLAQLQGTDSKQEAAKATLPKETEQLRYEKGRLYMLLKKLVRAGRMAHGNRGPAAAAYNLDILDRERQSKKKEPAAVKA